MDLHQAIDRLCAEAKRLARDRHAWRKLDAAIDRLAALAHGRAAAPRCSKCGIELTTALAAVVCPRRDACEFWPDDAASQDFVRMMRDDDTRGGGHDIKDKP